MKLGSLFDGIGGWPLASVKYNIEPVWASEIEKFPIAVTKHHFPNMRHLGDIRNINGADIEPVDILCAGSPCQNLSVAGNRQGLAGAESSLFRDSVRIMREMRNHTNGQYPKYFVWENVPGAFSSNGGHDFKSVLEEIAETEIPIPESGRWATAGLVRGNDREIAWVTKDAQYFGVPQRRKRIFLVASFGTQCAGKILFDEEGLLGDSSPVGNSGQGTSFGTEVGAHTTGGIDDSVLNETERVVYSFDSLASNSMKSSNPYSGCHITNIAKTLDTTNPDPSKNQGGIAIFERQGCPGIRTFTDTASTLRAGAGAPKHLSDIKGRLVYAIQGNMIGRDEKNGPAGNGINEDISFTLTATDRHAVCVPEGDDLPHLASGKSVVGCLMANCATKQWLGNQEAFSGDYHIITGKTIRKLTPLECERLQGLPDGYTDIEIDGKPASDAARYKALGNGMAQPCSDFVIRRIVEVDNPD